MLPVVPEAELLSTCHMYASRCMVVLGLLIRHGQVASRLWWNRRTQQLVQLLKGRSQRPCQTCLLPDGCSGQVGMRAPDDSTCSDGLREVLQSCTAHTR